MSAYLVILSVLCILFNLIRCDSDYFTSDETVAYSYLIKLRGLHVNYH